MLASSGFKYFMNVHKFALIEVVTEMKLVRSDIMVIVMCKLMCYFTGVA